MTIEKITFVSVLHSYLIYSEAFSQYNRLDDDDKVVIKPYIDRLKDQWQQELYSIRIRMEYANRSLIHKAKALS